MLENDVVTAVLKDPEAQDALRVITRIAIGEVALRSNSAPPVEDTTIIGRMTIDRLRRTVIVKGQAHPIKPREFALLETLARRPGIVFSRERCITLAWPDDTDAIDRTVDGHVAHLRRMLGRDTVNIRTVPGVGYAIVSTDRLAGRRMTLAGPRVNSRGPSPRAGRQTPTQCGSTACRHRFARLQ